MSKQIREFECGERITPKNVKDFIGSLIVSKSDDDTLEIGWLDGVDSDGYLVDTQGYNHEELFVAVPVYKQ